MISPACKACPAYSTYCEYDPLTDTIYPNDPDQCLLLKGGLMLTYPYCDQIYNQHQNACCNTQTMIDAVNMSRVNIMPMFTYNPLLTGMLNAYVPPQPKSGRKVYRDLGDCWIVIAYESGPLKLLELELK